MSLFTIEHLRIGAALLWAVACLFMAPSLLRAARGIEKPGDTWRSVTFFCGLLFCLFPSRSMVAPNDELTREGLFAMSILLAFYVLRLRWVEWRTQR